MRAVLASGQVTQRRLPGCDPAFANAGAAARHQLQHHQNPGSVPARSQHRCRGRASHEHAPSEGDRRPSDGFIREDDLVAAVRTETRVHHYDQVIPATSRRPSAWLAQALRRDPAHRLRPRLGQRLIVSRLPWAYRPPHLRLRPDRRESVAGRRRGPGRLTCLLRGFQHEPKSRG